MTFVVATKPETVRSLFLTELWSEMLKEIIYSVYKNEVHFANGNKKRVKVILSSEKDSVDMVTEQIVQKGQVITHVTLGISNMSNVQVNVLMPATGDGGTDAFVQHSAKKTLSNRGVIFTASAVMIDAAYSRLFSRFTGSGIWRGVDGNCHKPNCPQRKRGEPCKCR